MSLKVISGGQTGADRTALEVAFELGFPTGGTAPQNFKTEAGNDFTLRDVFHLVDNESPSYAVRTRINARDGDVTVWFGKTGSAGYVCTKKWADHYHKPLLICPPDDLLTWIVDRKPKIINCAGNRLSTNPSIVKVTRAILFPVLLFLKQEELLQQAAQETPKESEKP